MTTPTEPTLEQKWIEVLEDGEGMRTILQIIGIVMVACIFYLAGRMDERAAHKNQSKKPTHDH